MDTEGWRCHRRTKTAVQEAQGVGVGGCRGGVDDGTIIARSACRINKGGLAGAHVRHVFQAHKKLTVSVLCCVVLCCNCSAVLCCVLLPTCTHTPQALAWVYDKEIVANLFAAAEGEQGYGCRGAASSRRGCELSGS